MRIAVQFKSPLRKSFELTAAQKSESEALLRDFNKSPFYNWGHPLQGSTIQRSNMDQSGVYQAGQNELASHIKSEPKSRLTQMRSVARTKKGDLVYDVEYTVDQLFRRVVPEPNQSKTETILLTGCSFAFGYGLKDRETIQYNLGRLRPFAKITNLAVCASAVNNQLALLNMYPKRATLPKAKKSIGVYIYIDDHLVRVSCGRKCLYSDSSWVKRMPRFVEEKGQLKFKELFDQSLPWSSGWATALRSFEILGLWPGLIEAGEESVRRLFAHLIYEYQSKLKESAGISELVVFNAYSSIGEFSLVQKELNRFGIRTFDVNFMDFKVLIGRGLVIPVDGHPAPPAAYVLAWLIDRRLRAIGF